MADTFAAAVRKAKTDAAFVAEDMPQEFATDGYWRRYFACWDQMCFANLVFVRRCGRSGEIVEFSFLLPTKAAAQLFYTAQVCQNPSKLQSTNLLNCQLCLPVPRTTLQQSQKIAEESCDSWQAFSGDRGAVFYDGRFHADVKWSNWLKLYAMKLHGICDSRRYQWNKASHQIVQEKIEDNDNDGSLVFEICALQDRHLQNITVEAAAIGLNARFRELSAEELVQRRKSYLLRDADKILVDTARGPNDQTLRQLFWRPQPSAITGPHMSFWGTNDV